MTSSVDDIHGRIRGAILGALAGETAAGLAAGAADILGVAESVAACSCFDEADLRHRGLERPSRSGAAGLLLRALPFGLLTPLDRPRIRRDAYRCLSLAGADEGAAVTGVAAAMLVADLLRFDVDTALLRVHQSLLEDAPMALLTLLRPGAAPSEPGDADPAGALQRAITALSAAGTVAGAVQAAAGGAPAAMALAGALAGAHGGDVAVDGLETASLPHAERGLVIAARLGDAAAGLLPRPETLPLSG